jgi:hypothetical protein
MRDDELENWRREWRAQPTAPLDLIRRVERQTLYMRLDWAAQILPGIIGVASAIIAAILRSAVWIVLTCGMWLFITVGWWFMNQNMKGIWSPVAETTSAYVALSIQRCRRKLTSLRFDVVFSVLLTGFSLLMVYEVLASSGALRTSDSRMVMFAAFLLAMGGVGVFLLTRLSKRRKTESELAYLLELHRRMEKDRP